MPTITGLPEDFETPASGAAITTGNSVFDAVTTGTAGTAAVTTANPFSGTKSLRVTTTADNVTLRADITSTSSAWVGFALRYLAFPSAVGTFLQFATGSTITAALRVNTTGSLAFRDGATTRWTSTGLALNTWYEVRVQATPGTSGRVKIYNADGSLLQDSGPQTLATTGAIDNIRFGSLAGNVASDTQWDRILGDTTTEPARLNTPAPPPDPETWTYTPPAGWSPLEIVVKS